MIAEALTGLGITGAAAIVVEIVAIVGIYVGITSHIAGKKQLFIGGGVVGLILYFSF